MKGIDYRLSNIYVEQIGSGNYNNEEDILVNGVRFKIGYKFKTRKGNVFIINNLLRTSENVIPQEIRCYGKVISGPNAGLSFSKSLGELSQDVTHIIMKDGRAVELSQNKEDPIKLKKHHFNTSFASDREGQATEPHQRKRFTPLHYFVMGVIANKGHVTITTPEKMLKDTEERYIAATGIKPTEIKGRGRHSKERRGNNNIYVMSDAQYSYSLRVVLPITLQPDTKTRLEAIDGFKQYENSLIISNSAFVWDLIEYYGFLSGSNESRIDIIRNKIASESGGESNVINFNNGLVEKGFK